MFFDQRLEIFLNLVDFGELHECPATIGLEVVHTGNPVGFHGGLLFFGIFTSISLDLDNQVKWIIFASTIVNEDDEVGYIRTIL